MNTKICTSIEQSKKLLNLGLDPCTADMYYKYVLPKSDKLHHVPDVGEPTNALSWYNKGYTFKGIKEPLELKDFCIPCWSLAALLELMPKTIEKQGVEFFLRILCYESNWYIDYASLEQSYLYSSQLKSLVEASILIIEQLIQEKHIKVNK